MYRRIGKRFLDCALASMGIIVTCIPMLAIILAIKLDSKGPAVFHQRRLGRHRKVFTIYKFRTMVDHAYEIGGVAKRSDDARITRIGAVLRRTSLDELPQMFNILRGEMSIIGPRPILVEEFEAYANNAEYAERFDVLPGLFCTVDVDYRASANRDLQFRMDAEYARSLSFAGDVSVFFRVLRSVISGKNVYAQEIDEKRRRECP